MALASTTEWEVRQTGSDLNGGGFDASSPGVNYSLQDAPQVNVSDLVTNGTTTVTSASGLFTSAMLGNNCYIASGTGGIVPGVYRVASFTNSTTIVLDRSTGLTTGTGATCRLGGALASPGRAGGLKVSDNTIFIKSGLYLITTATQNVSGGPINETTGGGRQGRHAHWIGYDTNRFALNSDTTLPELKSAVTGVTLFAGNATDGVNTGGIDLYNLIFNGDSLAGTSGIVRQSGEQLRQRVFRCWVKNCATTGIDFGQHLTGCRVSGMTGGTPFPINGDPTLQWCTSHDNTGPGFGKDVGISAGDFHHCLAYSNTGRGFSLRQGTNNLIAFCTSALNGGSGFHLQPNPSILVTMMNNIAWGNGGWGIDVFTGQEVKSAIFVNNAFGNNTSGAMTTSMHPTAGTVTLTADPFVNSAAGDFRLNDVAGGGALLKGTGWPQTLPVL